MTASLVDDLTIDQGQDGSTVSVLDRLSLAGTRGLVVDLSEVTHLASAAVAELHRVAPDGHGYPLRLFAPAGTNAHHVLSLVNLPHTTIAPDQLDEPGLGE